MSNYSINIQCNSVSRCADLLLLHSNPKLQPALYVLHRENVKCSGQDFYNMRLRFSEETSSKYE